MYEDTNLHGHVGEITAYSTQVHIIAGSCPFENGIAATASKCVLVYSVHLQKRYLRISAQNDGATLTKKTPSRPAAYIDMEAYKVGELTPR